MKKLLLLCLAALTVATNANADKLRFAYYPSLSPDGKTIYFSYNGDIYSVASEGGTARSTVNIGGYENRPLVSPDGEYLAFSSDTQGNSDVYVIKLKSGELKQLTYSEATDSPVSWSADSKYIYFESTRSGARKTSFRVRAEGGTPELMFEGYFNTVVNLVENPKTGEFLFNESTESINFPTRKGYVGDHNPNIKSWNPSNGTYKELTDYEGKDQWPMVDRKGNIYYVSDQYNKEGNIYKYVKGQEPQRLTGFDESVQYPSLSADGSAMVFLKDYAINLLDLSSGMTSEPEIIVNGSTVEVKRQFQEQKPSRAAVSPDGKKFALIIRGQLFVSDAKAKYLQKLDTPSNERVNEVLWGKDNRSIYFTRTNRGWIDLYCISGDNSSKERLIYRTESNIKNLTKSNKGDKIAFIEGNHNVMLYDMESDSAERIAEAEFWSFQSYDLSFSPDDDYIAFDAMNRFEPDIYIYSLKEKKLRNLTHSASVDENAVFSPDGKYLYFLSNPTSTSFPRGAQSALYKLPLQKYDTPFKSDSFDKLFADDSDEKKESAQDKKADKKDVKNEEKKALEIDFSNVYKRMQRVERSGSQSNLHIFSGKDKSLLLYSSYNGNGSSVYALDLKDPEAKPKAVKDLNGGSFFHSDNELYALSGGNILKIDPNSLSTSKISIAQNLEKVLADEFSQMFFETWAVLEQNYYDVNFHGADWYAVRDRYASFLPYVKNRQDLRTLISDMLGELNSSHLGFTSNGNEEKTETKIRTLATGIVFDNKDPYKVGRIITDSPADKVGIDIKKGDELIAVNGVKIDRDANREMYFASAVPSDEIKLSFRRAGKEKDVKLHTTSLSDLRTLEYAEWEAQRKSMVNDKGKGRIAYHHMRAMSDSDLNDFLLAMYSEALDKDALILDLRYNNGGNVHREVIDFLRQEKSFEWSYRDFPTTTHPNVTPKGKPIVVLVNEHSLSDAEVTSNGIKTLGIATLVGTETYRWIIFTSSFRLIDGSSCRIPAWGCYNLEGEDLEHAGVKPDIYVRNTFKDRLTGKDPQLDAAIKEVLKQLD